MNLAARLQPLGCQCNAISEYSNGLLGFPATAIQSAFLISEFFTRRSRHTQKNKLLRIYREVVLLHHPWTVVHISQRLLYFAKWTNP
jgi:hypothetical protein